MTKAYWIIALLLLCSCTGPQGPQGEQGVQGPKGQQGDKGSPGSPADMTLIQGWFDTLAVRQNEMFGRTEQLESSNMETRDRLSRLEQWPYDSLVGFYQRVRETENTLALIYDRLSRLEKLSGDSIVALSRKLAVMSEALDSLKGPIGTPDSLGNICYEVEPDQTFRYFLYHNFKDTLGNYEEGIRYHTAIEAYRTVADLYAGRQYDKSSLDYQWHDYNYARFKDVAILTKDGLQLRIPVNIILPYRNMYYVIAHTVIDKAGNESTWNRSIDEGYYVRVK